MCPSRGDLCIIPPVFHNVNNYFKKLLNTVFSLQQRAQHALHEPCHAVVLIQESQPDVGVDQLQKPSPPQGPCKAGDHHEKDPEIKQAFSQAEDSAGDLVQPVDHRQLRENVSSLQAQLQEAEDAASSAEEREGDARREAERLRLQLEEAEDAALSAEEQASDRVYRIGQKNSVTVYKLIADRSIEQNILGLQEKKAALSDIAVGGDRDIMHMSADEIISIIE